MDTLNIRRKDGRMTPFLSKKTLRQTYLHRAVLPRIFNDDPNFLVNNKKMLTDLTLWGLEKCSGGVWVDAAADLNRWITDGDRDSIEHVLTTLKSEYDPYRAVSPFSPMLVKKYMSKKEIDEIIEKSKKESEIA